MREAWPIVLIARGHRHEAMPVNEPTLCPSHLGEDVRALVGCRVAEEHDGEASQALAIPDCHIISHDDVRVGLVRTG